LQHSSQIPADALLVAEGRKQVHYAAAIACGVMSIGVGLIAPAFTGFILAMPAAFIGTLAGVAMFTPLKNAFLAGFSGGASAGALACFIATFSAMWTTAIALDLIGFSMLGALGVPWLVIVGMFVAGVGGGFLGPLSMVLVTEDIPEKLRGRAFSVFTAVNQFAAPIGLVAVTALLTQADIYLVAAILAVIWAFISVWAIARGFRIFPPHAPASADNGSARGN